MTPPTSKQMTSADIVSNEKFVLTQFPLLAAMANHNGSGLEQEAMALLDMATNLRLEALHSETTHEWLPNQAGSFTCDCCGAVSTLNPAAPCVGRDAVKTPSEGPL